MAEAEIYSKIRRASFDGSLSSSDLGPLVKELAAAIEAPVPTSVAQKRAFVQNWADDQRGKYTMAPDTLDRKSVV